MRRPLAPLLLLGLLGGCGGGGATPPAASTAAEVPPASSRTMEEVLADCVTQDVRDGLAFLTSVGAATQDAGVEGFAVTGFDLASLRFGWTLDGDLDGTPEAEGTLRFVDAAGRATLPLDLGVLLAGVPAPETLFADVPDGTRALLTFDLLRFVEGRGDLDVEFVGGQPRRADGTMTLADGPCASTLRFEDLLLPATAGGYPTGVLRLEARTAAERVDGTLTLDGTSLGRLHGTVDGGAAQDAVLDLTTGQLE